MTSDRNLLAEQLLELAPAIDVAVESGRMIATSAEPWLRFKSLAPFQASRFIEITYRSSLYDDPVRPILRFMTEAGAIERFLPGPVAGAGIWRGTVPRKLSAVLICPAARAGRFDFRVENVRPLSFSEIAALVWERRPRKLFDILLATTFGYIAEAENAVDWAIGAEPLHRFPAWRAKRERPLDLSGVDKPRSDWSDGPTYLIFVDARRAAGESLGQTIASLQAQSYEKFRAVVIGSPASSRKFEQFGDSRVTNSVDARPKGEALPEGSFLQFLQAGDVLLPHALALVTEGLACTPSAKLVYGDEIIEESVGPRPLFKPGWSPIFNASRSYLGRSVFISANEFSSRGVSLDAARLERYAPEIAAKLARNEIRHLRRWLLLRRREQTEIMREPPIAIEPARVTSETPTVTIIMPTRDRADLLGPCVDSVLRLSTHQRFELLIIDNGTRQPRALKILEKAVQDARVRVLRRPGPFNFAALNNEAARLGSGNVLVFLNNDTVIVTPDWLEQLCQLALQEKVGAVGCLLLYPNGLIQHAGVVIGLGQDAGHFEALQTEAAPSWLDRTRSVREASAVTAACLCVERKKFLAVGGFDEENLPIEFNDVDLCLRLTERGWASCYTPNVRLIHKESATRGGASARPLSVYAKERDYFRARWRAVIRDDPYFHPGLSLYSRQAALG
jgi:GT2 family glycosyltransferase